MILLQSKEALPQSDSTQRFDLSNSALALNLVLLLHLPLALLVMSVNAQLWAKLLASVLLLMGVARNFFVRSLTKNLSQFVLGGKQCNLIYRNGASATYTIGELFVTRWLIVIQFQNGLRLPGALCLLPGSFNSEAEFRACFIACRRTKL